MSARADCPRVCRSPRDSNPTRGDTPSTRERATRPPTSDHEPTPRIPAGPKITARPARRCNLGYSCGFSERVFNGPIPGRTDVPQSDSLAVLTLALGFGPLRAAPGRCLATLAGLGARGALLVDIYLY